MYTSLLFASFVCLTTSLRNGHHHIVQPYRVDTTDGQATVECLYASPPRPQPQELYVTLLKGLHDQKVVCGGYINSTAGRMRTQKPNVCQATLTESGIRVTAEGLRGEDTDLYRCKVEVIYPPPYLTWYGNGTLVHILEKTACSAGKFQHLLQQSEDLPTEVVQGTEPSHTQEERQALGVQWVEVPFPLLVALGILIVIAIFCQIAGVRHTRRPVRSTQPLTSVIMPKGC